jgi:tetratricopeptide (TPR) repeat protein
MNLSNRQKKWIDKNYRKYSAQHMAGELGVSEKIVNKFLHSKGNKRTPFYFYLILIGLPIFFFVLLELSLRIFGYGMNSAQWIPATSNKLILNPELARRYFFTTQSIPYSNQDVFDEVKNENCFRVFVMGGSSAAGFPYSPNGSFSKYIRKRLELVYPTSKIEVINISMAAINSYTLRDLLPETLEQKPDLLIIYAGHNEYYGALGVGSTESLGNYQPVILLYLYLQRFKSFILIKDLIYSLTELFSKKTVIPGSLMRRMAKERLIDLNSDLYTAGLNQFEENIRDILKTTINQNIPIFLCTLVSNLKDQISFESMKTKGLPLSIDIYNQANSALQQDEIRKADSLFRFAKDLDALRFRAPEEINEIIKRLGTEYKINVLDIDSTFTALSSKKIIGDDLICDHLHPNLSGYQLIGKIIYEEMERFGFLPTETSESIDPNDQDYFVRTNYDFSDLDVQIANYRIFLLKQDWPFVNRNLPFIRSYQSVNTKSYLDTLALDVVSDNIDWDRAHINLARMYLKNGDQAGYIEEMNVIIDKFPYIFRYYQIAVQDLLSNEFYNEALPYLESYNSMEPDEFSTKWLGIINLANANTEIAINYLEESIKYNHSDPQSLYNLAGAYSLVKDYKKALRTVEQCLKIKPELTSALDLKKNILSKIDKD